MHLLNRYCQFKAYKDDKSNFVFKSMLFAKFTQAHAAFGRGFAISSDGYFFFHCALKIVFAKPEDFETWLPSLD